MRTFRRAAYGRPVMDRNSEIATRAHHHERLVVVVAAAVAAVATGFAIGRPEAFLDQALTVARSIFVGPWWLDVAP